MGRSRYKIKEDYFPYLITLSVVEGISLFDYPILSEIVLDSLKFMREKSGEGWETFEKPNSLSSGTMC